MYLCAAHVDPHTPSLQSFIHDNPLGLLFTALHSSTFPTLQCIHIPWILDIDATSTTTASADDDNDNENFKKPGTLRDHMARNNPHAQALSESAKIQQQQRQQQKTPQEHFSNDWTMSYLREQVTVLFTSPVNAYVTPRFYTTTKPASGNIIPTWKYAAVQVYGRARDPVGCEERRYCGFLARADERFDEDGGGEGGKRISRRRRS